MSPADPTPCDLLVRNGCVITMDGERRIFDTGAIAIRDSRILEVGPDDLAARFRPIEVIDAGGGIVHPGLVECHMHISFHLWRWAYPDVEWGSYIGYIQDYYERLTPEDEELASTVACLELARNGTTCYMDAGSVFEPDVAAAATHLVGIRGLLGDPFVMDVVAPHRRRLERIPANPRRAFTVLGEQLRRNRDSDALVRGHVALLGLGSASDELEKAAKELADRHGVIFNQHQSWHPSDVAADDALRGGPVLVHFAHAGVLGPNCTWSHVNFLRDGEFQAVVDSGMSVCWCPSASMILGVGATQRAHHAEMLHRGVNVCLGSDSAASSGSYDVFEQAVLAMFTARDKLRDLSLSAERALTMATINGARAVGMEDEIGSLESGKRADLVIHRSDIPEALPGVDPVRTAVMSTRSKGIHTVIVNGTPVVRGGRSVRVDEAAVFARLRHEARRLLHDIGRE
jgi:5-methylthioadenosine/S-adenosylhomocysteine deaminase